MPIVNVVIVCLGIDRGRFEVEFIGFVIWNDTLACYVWEGKVMSEYDGEWKVEVRKIFEQKGYGALEGS